MTGPIRALLEQAADEVETYDVVAFDTQARLASEGYLLCALERDTTRIIERRAAAL